MADLIVGKGSTVKIPGVNDAAWTTFNPSPTPDSGAFNNVTGSGAYFQLGKTVFVRLTINITDKGTGVGLNCTVPVALKTGPTQVLVGREILATGSVWHAFSIGPNTFNVRKYDNNTALTNGWQIDLSGVYEAE